MRNLKVWRELGTIYSKETREEDNRKKGGGKIKVIRLFEMDEAEAKRQLGWVKDEYKKAKNDLKKLKESVSRKGIQEYLNEQRKKIRQTKEHLEDMENLKKQSEGMICVICGSFVKEEDIDKHVHKNIGYGANKK